MWNDNSIQTTASNNFTPKRIKTSSSWPLARADLQAGARIGDTHANKILKKLMMCYQGEQARKNDWLEVS